MTTETFAWAPQLNAQGATTYRVLKAQFGDGYSQRAPDGINNEVQSWPLSFTGTGAYVTPIRDFLRRHGGAGRFAWTPPLGEAGLYVCGGFNLMPLGGDKYTLSATFEQVFAA